MKTKLLSAVLLALALAGAAHAVDVSVAAEIRLGRALPPPPPEIVVVEPAPRPGPPPWAPAHGFRRNRAYYYYPEAAVYYRPADRAWFYLDGGHWRFAAALPTHVRIDFTRSVALTMETDRPFEHHRHVAHYYPGNYFTKVKIKERGASAKPGRDERGAGEHPGRGKGQNKGKGQGRN